MKLRAYYELTKPGIIYGNLIVAAAGFIHAYNHFGSIDWGRFTATLVGLGLVIAGACVFNNYYDRDIDKKMARTKSRALAAGTISNRAALIFGCALFIVGAAVLYFSTTVWALAAALIGFLVYVFAYTPLKHLSGHALWVGAVAGATPPVVGYTSVTGILDMEALWLFVFLFVWQVIHFIGIAAYRYDEYIAAGVPLLIRRPSTRWKKIGRKVFYYSLVVLLVWCGALILHR